MTSVTLVEEFKKLGVEITFFNRQIAASPQGRFLLQIQGVISEYEREKIVERHRRGKLHKAQQGKVCVLAGAPYGYAYIRATENEDARYEIHEGDTAVVSRMFEMPVKEGLSLGTITHHLTQEKLPTRRDIGHWHRSVIAAILKNPAYMAQAAWFKTQLVDRIRPNRQAYDREETLERANRRQWWKRRVA